MFRLAAFQQRVEGLKEEANEGPTVLHILNCILSNICKLQLEVPVQA